VKEFSFWIKFKATKWQHHGVLKVLNEKDGKIFIFEKSVLFLINN